MTPTRYPGWRLSGIALGLINAMFFFGGAYLYSHESASIRSVGWLTNDWDYIEPSQREVQFYSFELATAVIAIGALVSLRRPSMGFLIISAGHLTSAASLIVLFQVWELRFATAFVAVGIWYAWLGMKQLSADRVSA